MFEVNKLDPGGYIDFKEGDANYNAQPVERSAFETGTATAEKVMAGMKPPAHPDLPPPGVRAVAQGIAARSCAWAVSVRRPRPTPATSDGRRPKTFPKAAVRTGLRNAQFTDSAAAATRYENLEFRFGG